MYFLRSLSLSATRKESVLWHLCPMARLVKESPLMLPSRKSFRTFYQEVMVPWIRRLNTSPGTATSFFDFPNQALIFLKCTPISFFAASFCLFSSCIWWTKAWERGYYSSTPNHAVTHAPCVIWWNSDTPLRSSTPKWHTKIRHDGTSTPKSWHTIVKVWLSHQRMWCARNLVWPAHRCF